MAMVLKKKTKKRQKRDDLANQLEEWIGIAKEEDMWDSRLWNMGLATDGRAPWGERYEPEAVQAFRTVKSSMRTMEERSMELAGKFREIINKERAAKEGKIAEYKREKRKRLRQRARERMEAQKETKV